jgi:uncharacterized repeat protein (TIGR02543 family)
MGYQRLHSQFYSNGGSAVTSQNVSYNATATEPAAPVKTGYTFSGWFSDAGLASLFSFNTPITGDITLYAKWEIKNYTDTFNSNGGSAISNQNLAYNTTTAHPADPTQNGYSFAGWYSDAALTNIFKLQYDYYRRHYLVCQWR